MPVRRGLLTVQEILSELRRLCRISDWVDLAGDRVNAFPFVLILLWSVVILVANQSAQFGPPKPVLQEVQVQAPVVPPAVPPLTQKKPPSERDKSPGPPEPAIKIYLARVISLVRPPTISFIQVMIKVIITL